MRLVKEAKLHTKAGASLFLPLQVSIPDAAACASDSPMQGLVWDFFVLLFFRAFFFLASLQDDSQQLRSPSLLLNETPTQGKFYLSRVKKNTHTQSVLNIGLPWLLRCGDAAAVGRAAPA